MNVFISTKNGLQRGIQYHLEKDGHEILSSHHSADLVITDDTSIRGRRTIWTDVRLPRVCLEMSGIEHEAVDGRVIYGVSRWFEKDHWQDQTIVGIPIIGTQNGGLGKATLNGFAMRYSQIPRGTELFENKAVVEMLTGMGHTGWVTFEMGREGPVNITLGIFSIGVYCTMEGWKGSIGEWFLSPEKLLESWVIGTVVSRFPWPVEQKYSPVRLSLDHRSLHSVWPIDYELRRRETTIVGGLVGVVTGWHKNLSEAGRRSLEICQKIDIPEIQYRTDIAFEASETYSWLTSICRV